jgi:hypothetical protein
VKDLETLIEETEKFYRTIFLLRLIGDEIDKINMEHRGTIQELERSKEQI